MVPLTVMGEAGHGPWERTDAEHVTRRPDDVKHMFVFTHEILPTGAADTHRDTGPGWFVAVRTPYTLSFRSV